MNNWTQVIGHDWAVKHLTAAIQHNRIGHAYLITGPAHIGKATLARTFAQALNCLAENPAEQPCGRCRACTLIASGRHPDVRLVTGEVSGRGKLTLKIDQIRQLQQELSLAAYEARYKVAILKQFDAANPSAANAFLKTLEEPPANVILLLTAGEADTLLPTINSRCRTMALRPLPTPAIAQALQGRWQIGAEQANLLAHLADGRLGWAVLASQQPQLLKEREKQLDTLQAVLAERRVGRFALADKLSQKPENLPDLLQSWLSWWRDLVLLAWGKVETGLVTNVDRQEQLQELVGEWTAAQILAALKRTETALWQLERNANTKLVLENLFLTYPLVKRET